MAQGKAPATSAKDLSDEDTVYVQIDQIHEYVNNPRKNDHAVDQMAAIIRTHGFRVPILVRTRPDNPDRYDLVDGHLRIKAARKLGLTDLPAVLVDDMTDAQVRAFRISVNRAAGLADWDAEKLRLEVDDIRLSADDAIPTLTGFDEASLSALVRDNMPPTPARKSDRDEPVSRRADRHRATAETDTVELKLTLTAAERVEAMNALAGIRKQRDLSTNGEAFMAVLREAAALAQVAPPRTRTRTRA